MSLSPVTAQKVPLQSPDTAQNPAGKKCEDCEMLQKEFEKNPGGKPARNPGLIFVAVTGGAAVALSAVCAPFVSPALRKVCLPYVPATGTQISNVLKALSGRSGTLVDIGSGDGRIVFAAAKAGFRAHGVELNPWLVLYSKISAFRLGLRSSATFARADLFKTDFSRYENVVVFGVDSLMPELDVKLAKDLKPATSVVACRFPFEGRIPDEEIGVGVDTVWLYKNFSQKSPTNQERPN